MSSSWKSVTLFRASYILDHLKTCVLHDNYHCTSDARIDIEHYPPAHLASFVHGVAYDMQGKNQGIISVTGGTDKHVYPTEVLITPTLWKVFITQRVRCSVRKKKTEVERPTKFVLF